MSKYKIWARVYNGPGNWAEEEGIEEFPDDYTQEQIDSSCEGICWELLSNLNVETGWEELEEE